ncbi:hypothetical protein TWF102_002127 [Orbilia oligospora]|uniref:Amino acid permease/ SLC12A domain-containing protein n=1 Tax=Orbilia oligospora TaxID=2813651 RepID=A0A7C8NGM5_ORBOL|nr:hypothetical protein TWF102_002127 [Orbilia oligospora]KAF3088016.1 hypothetical protein TWF706_010998 [Orbilia oligospora]KAF3115481.1 hypothetical protein TWF103_010892 [Orbilia oligospora]KAF3143834.1 hypothetical protein TWF594_004910 [Orbilia oligospora]
MAQQYSGWNEGNSNHDNRQYDISPRPLQYRESGLSPYNGMPNTMTSSMQSLHSEVSQQIQDMSNPPRSYPINHSHNHPIPPGSGQYPHRIASSEYLPQSAGQTLNRPAPYANSWHHGQSNYEEVQEPPRTARRATSFHTEEAVGYATTTPAPLYNGRHSRRSSAARSIPGQPRSSSEQGEVYSTAMPSPNLQGPLPMPRISSTSLHYAYHNSEDAITPSIDTTAVSRRSHQSYRNATAPNQSPTINGELMAYEVDGHPISNTAASHAYPFPNNSPGNNVVKEGAADERSIATSGDDGDMIVRQDLRRQLHERHVGMIALTGAIGIGLFLTSGRVLKIAGPGGAVLAYFLMGTVANAVMACLGEMTALISIPGPMSEFASRFVDDSLGFAVGWMFWFTHAIGLASETTAAAILMTFVYKNTGVTTIPTPEFDWPKSVFASDAVWIAIFLILVLLVNLLPVRIYGEFEYVFAWIKLTCIIGLIFVMLVLNLRSTDRYGRDGLIGFRYWSKCTDASSLQYTANCTQHPEWGFFAQAFDSGRQKIWANLADPIRAEYLQQDGDLGRLKSVWTALTLAFYAYLGMEIISVTAAESRAPALSIKTSTRKMFWRLATLYCIGMFVGSLNVPYTHPNLLSLRPDNSEIQGKVSPFIIAVVEAGIIGLPSFLNALFLFAAWSAGVSALFVSSRTMHAMALAGHFPIPKMKEVNRYGVPVNAMLLSWLVGFLAFLQSGNNAQEVLGYLVKLGTISCLIVYACISASYIRFFEGLRHRNTFSRRDARYPYRSRFQPIRAWYGLIGSSMVVIFNGWEFCTSDFVDEGSARAKGFIFSYLAFVGFLVLYFGRKLVTGSEFVPVASMDFAGARLRQDVEITGKHWLIKVWDWLK